MLFDMEKKINDETLRKVIETATLIATCAYEVYKIWKG